MTIPILEIKSGSKTQLLYGSGARYVAESDGILTMRPIDNNAVIVRAIAPVACRKLNGGDTLTTALAAGDTIELV